MNMLLVLNSDHAHTSGKTTERLAKQLSIDCGWSLHIRLSLLIQLLQYIIHIFRIDQIRDIPAVDTILRHTGVHKALHAITQPGSGSSVKRDEAVLIGRTGGNDFIKLVTTTKLRGKCVPE